MLKTRLRAQHSSLFRMLVIVMIVPLVLAACSGDDNGDTDDSGSNGDAAESAEGDTEEDDSDAAASEDESDSATEEEDDSDSSDATEEEGDSEEATEEEDEGDDSEASSDGDGDSGDSAEDPSFDLSGQSIRVTGATPDALGMPFYKMVDYLEEWGADVEQIELTSTTGIQALIAGQSDMGGQGTDELILGAAQGADVKAIAVTRDKMDYVLVGTEEIQSIEDLEGMSVGMSGPAGFDTLLTRLAVRRSDIPMDSVNFVQIGGSPDRASALLSGQVDAATIFISDWNEIDAQSDDLHDVVFMADLASTSTKSVILTESSYIEENPEVAQATACANLEAFQWFDENRDEFIEYTLENVDGATEEATSATYDQMIDIEMFPPDSSELLLIEGVQELADTMYEAGEIENEVNAEDLVDRSFLEEAASMGCGQ